MKEHSKCYNSTTNHGQVSEEIVSMTKSKNKDTSEKGTWCL